jgi:uncharacterized membrane protein required for colicin V production
MNWLDIVLFLVIGVAALTEMSRGFGRAALDALGLYGALWVANALSIPLAASVHLDPHPAINHCVSYSVLFLVFGAFSLAVSRFVYGVTMFHTGMFDGMLGLVAGLAVGMMVAHGIARTVAMSDATGQNASVVTESFLGNEMLSFTTYHSVLDTLSGLTAPRHTIPDVNS